jgi:hypothetical protein
MQLRYYQFAVEESAADGRRNANTQRVANFFLASSSSSSSSSSDEPASWPGFAAPQESDFIYFPTEHELKTYSLHYHESIKRFLRDDLLSRVPGTHISVDATYRVASRTNDADAVCIVFVFGMFGEVIRWFVLNGDNDGAITPGIKRWRENLKVMSFVDPRGGRPINALRALKFIVDDTCCRGADDLAAVIFRNPWCRIPELHAPKKDTWHGVDLVVKNTTKREDR